MTFRKRCGTTLSIWRYQKYVERPARPDRRQTVYGHAAGHCSSTPTSTPTGVWHPPSKAEETVGAGRCDVMSVPTLIDHLGS